MQSMLKLEVKKAFKNKFFWIAITIGCLITLLSFIPNVSSYYQDVEKAKQYLINSKDISEPYTYVRTLFNKWIGGEPFSIGTAIYFFVFPLLVALPYGWSYSEEKQNGYRRMMISRVGKKEYYIGKYVAVFLSGGIAMILPLLVNLWMIAMCIPVVLPDVTASMFYGVFGSSFLSEVFYTAPHIYILAYLLIDFIYGGLLACISFSISAIIKQKWVAVIVPFIVLLSVHTITRFIYSDATIIYREISPLYFLRGVDARYSSTGTVIFLFGLILLVVSIIGVVKEYQSEIY